MQFTREESRQVLTGDLLKQRLIIVTNPAGCFSCFLLGNFQQYFLVSNLL